jgi:hypothetical protein
MTRSIIYSLRVTESRKTGKVTSTWNMKIVYKILVDITKGNRPLGRMGTDEIIMLKLCYINRPDYTDPRQSPVAGS